MKKRKILYFIGILCLVMLALWNMMHPMNSPVNRIDYNSFRIRNSNDGGRLLILSDADRQQIINELQNFHFKRANRLDDAVGWSLGLSWDTKKETEWIILAENGIEYKDYLYKTEKSEEYLEFRERLYQLNNFDEIVLTYFETVEEYENGVGETIVITEDSERKELINMYAEMCEYAIRTSKPVSMPRVYVEYKKDGEVLYTLNIDEENTFCTQGYGNAMVEGTYFQNICMILGKTLDSEDIFIDSFWENVGEEIE